MGNSSCTWWIFIGTRAPTHDTPTSSSRPLSFCCHKEFIEEFPCRNCGGGDRGGVAIYRPFGEFRRAKIALSPVWCSRPTTGVPLAHATMNFVGLDLTTADRKASTGYRMGERNVSWDSTPGWGESS
ncbi:hypothetical protein TNCV_312041 [Trichonephila clavipes]|nr:hypothetical protein TNCV_312041 [Trichonephila clavipes]